MAIKRSTTSKMATRPRAVPPLFVSLTSGDVEWGLAPTESAIVLASELAVMTGRPVAVRCCITDRILRHVLPTVAGRA